MPESGASQSSDLWVFWARIRGFLAREKKLYAVASVFEILTLGTLLLYPQLIKYIVDEGIESGSMDRINTLVLMMVGVLVVQAVSGYLRKYLFELAAQRVSTAIRIWLFGNIIVQEMTFFDGERTGELMARLTEDVGKLALTMRQIVPELIHFVLMGGFAILLMFHTSPQLSIAVLLVGPAIWGVTAALGKRLRRYSTQQQDLSAEANQISLDAISSIETVRLYHAEQAEVDRYSAAQAEWRKVARQQARGISLLDSTSTFFAEGAVLVALWIGGALIVGGSLTSGSLVLFVLYSAILMRALKNVSQSVAELMRAQGASQRVFALGDRVTRMPIEGGVAPDAAEGHISLEDVHFRYPSRPDHAALRGVSLDIPRGELLALVGASGSGKSTIARLIARLYDPDAGSVKFDGRDLRDYDPAWLRKQISLVPAEAALFARSVAENIRFGRPEAKDAEVNDAARFAVALDFINALPDGYSTDVGDHGQLFSSGQRQRIAIARALLLQTKVLILDEATAALDTESEARLKDALCSLPHRPTIIMVSHRLSTIVDAQRVVLVADGELVAAGTHEELLAESPEYKDLVVNQLLA